MEIAAFPADKPDLRRQLAGLLAACFACYREDPAAEVESLLQSERLALCALEGDTLLGFIGAIPQYGAEEQDGLSRATGWELNPLAVLPQRQGQGIGGALTAALERVAAGRGASMLYLGCDDEDGRTSLSAADLFADPWEAVRNIRNLGRHPYTFYEKQGYRIVGVLPDANGPGKPDILMAKPVGRRGAGN